MRALRECRLPLNSPSGVVLAHLYLTPFEDAESAATAPLAELDESDACDYGETLIQIREAERYEYEVSPIGGADLRLRCSLANRRRSLGKGGGPDSGLIETRSFCGTLLLELVEGEVDNEKSAVATALLEVRSLKLDYRTQYRGMLRRVTDELVGLVADARSSAKVELRSSFEERTDAGWLQIQLELLREALEGAEFSAALQRVLSFPHEQLSTISDSVRTDRPIRWTQPAVRQLLAANPRRAVPPNHPLHEALNSVAERVPVPRRSRDLDTPENRFIKFALGEFRAFLTHAQVVFESSSGWGASSALARRLAATMDDWLGRGLFREIGEMRFVPLGSPVLQRKAGYREVLRWWLRFRTAAELSWEGGADVFHAGQRDVASLYEYWLFFELLDWFCAKCRGGERPNVEELIDGLSDGSPTLRLKKGVELGPFIGTFAGQSRSLSVRFAYNRRFEATQERHESGSWTRRLHPDYTLSFWPAEFLEAEAERRELLVHVHLDAKYRVDNIEDLFGSEGTAADDEADGTYNRQDLLKMHAYRDAIKRSQGAYVLYPGRSKRTDDFRGFHEILPGIGAFGIAPDSNGAAQGMESLEHFLDEVLAHLGNRTTAQERVSYHVSESYLAREPRVPYGALHLAESDAFGPSHRAPPPAEHMVLLAWYQTEEQRLLAEADEGFTFVRLGPRRGSLHVHPNLSRTRHIVQRAEGGVVAPGLLMLRELGFRVYTRTQLRAELKQLGKKGVAAWQEEGGGDDEEKIYALFRTRVDPDYGAQEWDGGRVMDLIEAFETDSRNKLVENVGRTSPYPRVLPLRDLLKTRLAAG